MANDPSVPPPGREHLRSRLTFLAVTASLSALITLAAGIGMGSYFWARGQIRYIGSAPAAPDERKSVAPIGGPCAHHACNYLLLGSDSRAGLSKAQQQQFGNTTTVTGQRSDTIIVVHTEPSQQRAIFLQFPRDLWVNIPGHGMNKINSAFEAGIEHGGAQLVAKTVRELTGLQVNHVMYVDLAGFEGVVNALGGVRMCVPSAMSDPLTGLSIPRAGCYEFDGQQALAFVRTRHQPCDTIPDFARIGRQQQFLRAVLAKLLSPGEIVHLPSLVPAVLKNIAVDQGLNPAELAYLAGLLKGVGTGAADFRVVPTTPATIYPNGVLTDVVQLVQPQASELFERIRDGKPLGNLGKELPQTPPSPAVIKVVVFDKASGGKAAGVLAVLTQGGFDTALGLRDASALGTKAKGSEILFRPGERAQADVVHGFLPNLTEVQAPQQALAGADVAVFVGSRYVPAPPSAPLTCP